MDVFQIGTLRYEQQIFAAADTISTMLNKVPTDGVLGCSFSTIAMGQTPTFLENLIKAQLIEQPIMSFTIKDGPVPQYGDLTIGGVDRSVMEPGTLRYYPVDLLGYWQISAIGLSVDNNVVPGTAMDCAMDTGSSSVFLLSG